MSKRINFTLNIHLAEIADWDVLEIKGQKITVMFQCMLFDGNKIILN